MSTVHEQLLRKNYGRAAKELLSPLLALLTEAHRVFGGDGEKFHILLLLALRMAEHRCAAEFDVDAVEAGRVGELPSLATNVKSIAASTGIPEETVRRKVRRLTEEGWIERRGNDLFYTAKAAHELGVIRALVMRGALQNHRTLERLAKEAERESEPASVPPSASVAR
jgi:hypothetical protein